MYLHRFYHWEGTLPLVPHEPFGKEVVDEALGTSRISQMSSAFIEAPQGLVVFSKRREYPLILLM
jgi:hypothetical protein